MTYTEAVFAVDLGGTLIRSAVVRGGNIAHRKSASTPRSVEGIVDKIIDDLMNAEHSSGTHFSAITISTLGPVDVTTGVIRDAPTIPGFVNVPIRDLLAERTGRHVTVFNDANAATYAEWIQGAGRGASDFCFVTVSTGIGSGFIADGRIVKGRTGAAGELGRCRVRKPGAQALTQLENTCSGTAIAAEATRLATEENHKGLLQRLRNNGYITSRDVATLANKKDELCCRILAGAAHAFAEELANLARLYDPQIIAIGGGVSRAGDAYWRPLRETFSSSLKEDGGPLPVLVPGELGDDAGLIGAALLAMDQMDHTPISSQAL